MIKKRLKIKGKLRSTIRRKSPEIRYSNLIRTGYIKITETKTYKPVFFLLQLIINLTSLILYYILKEKFFLYFIGFNYLIIWLYSFFLLMNDRFIDDSNKLFWIIMVLFIPFSIFLYPDFRVKVVKK